MWHHDNLSLYWSKDAQAYLESMPSPIEGWPERTWADRQVRLRGKWEEAVKAKASNKKQERQAGQLPGNGPETMSLDCYLFSYLKEGTGRNVIATFFMGENEEGKYSMADPQKTFDALERTIHSGSISASLIQDNFERIFLDRDDGTPSTLRRIVEANGCYIPDSANRDRHGRRLAAVSSQKKERQINIAPEAQTDLVDYLRRVVNGEGNLNQAPAIIYDLTGANDDVVDMTSGDGDDEEEEEEEEEEESDGEE